MPPRARSIRDDVAHPLGGKTTAALGVMLPLWLPRKGMKWVLLVGSWAWPLRYIIFAVGQPVWLVVLSLGLHGVGYAVVLVVQQPDVGPVAVHDLLHRQLRGLQHIPGHQVRADAQPGRLAIRPFRFLELGSHRQGGPLVACEERGTRPG